MKRELLRLTLKKQTCGEGHMSGDGRGPIGAKKWAFPAGNQQENVDLSLAMQRTEFHQQYVILEGDHKPQMSLQLQRTP